MNQSSARSQPILSALGISKSYKTGASIVQALHPLDLCIERGEFIALLGPSGSGKSTLLSILGCVLRPDAGELTFQGVSIDYAKSSELTCLRRHRIGFLFQYFNLLPSLSATDNVALSLLMNGSSIRSARGDACHLLARVGLADRVNWRVQDLSGGEMQRVAFCRAIIHKPWLIMADEPTGALDSESASRLIGLLKEIRQSEGATIVMATHNEALLAACTRVIRLQDGHVAQDQRISPSIGTHEYPL